MDATRQTSCQNVQASVHTAAPSYSESFVPIKLLAWPRTVINFYAQAVGVRNPYGSSLQSKHPLHFQSQTT